MFNIIRDNMMAYLENTIAYLNFSGFTFNRITFKDIIDILIVAFFIYKIILWIKETRAWSLFKGVVAVLIISSLAFLFGFTTVSWLVETTINVGVIAIIVLFQPELRKALEQLGKGRFVVPFISEGRDEILNATTVDELIIAVYAMAKVRTGALILVENEVKLGDLEQTGIHIDASVSSALLINIFEDKTPLHDGAVIIRHNRVAAASCILPLTQNEIGKELGTRHRAAVGASELSDACAIVVSEETGHVSIAMGGQLYKNVSPEDIRRRLSAGDEKTSRKLFGFRRGLK
ncbi:MAG: diadenylate cyclase CdaA [Clostridiales bacterium]|jgi:diadenylate cyclase|nr:diadenylate cyclase CdaA [Clostridiales bacterium]